MKPPAVDLSAAIEAAVTDRLSLLGNLTGRRADLPLRYWRQQAHFTTPADPVTARKAVESGTGAMPRILDRLGLSAADLATRLELPAPLVEARLEHPSRAPLVMLDGEDAIPPGGDQAAQAAANAAEVFLNADWGDTDNAAPSLRFYRPPGLSDPLAARDLYTLLWRLRAGMGHGPFPLDGIVFPKIEHAEEVDFVNGLLDRAESALGLDNGTIRVSYLIESGWAVAQLPQIALRAAPRLASLIFGVADFSADLRLPAIRTDHPLAAWARAEIVAVAGAVGVPAIDAMTLDFPVSEPNLDAGANRVRWLDRMRLVYDDAATAFDMGMQGKWVGHPAQLFAVLLAYEAALDREALEREATKLAAYEQALASDRGATIIDGVMSDRATDRHARARLRQATAQGYLDVDRAVDLGVITPEERDGIRRQPLGEPAQIEGRR